ncbi:hypothetical protein DM02DRAFT_206783 [Periconia macrospinosa]|uniref:Uncharacterized protein n=1 Tax=Periconia macrospinosa TaxID=97972 RepID=A0A2V1D8V9_9PLEO|nr:hypothetical protein DM02DRAFT_206783 [Periconia macrospinosa]
MFSKTRTIIDYIQPWGRASEGEPRPWVGKVERILENEVPKEWQTSMGDNRRGGWESATPPDSALDPAQRFWRCTKAPSGTDCGRNSAAPRSLVTWLIGRREPYLPSLFLFFLASTVLFEMKTISRTLVTVTCAVLFFFFLICSFAGSLLRANVTEKQVYVVTSTLVPFLLCTDRTTGRDRQQTCCSPQNPTVLMMHLAMQPHAEGARMRFSHCRSETALLIGTPLAYTETGYPRLLLQPPRDGNLPYHNCLLTSPCWVSPPGHRWELPHPDFPPFLLLA